MKTQDTKHYIHKDRLHGQGGIIPVNEPLFILRGRDVNAVKTLNRYLALCVDNGSDQEHLHSVKMVLSRFLDFAKKSSMKVPDTCIARLHDGKIAG